MKNLLEIKEGAKYENIYTIECVGPDGKVKWVETVINDVVTEGLNKVLNDVFKSGTQTATWYVGITGNTPTPAAADTLASHAGWTEVTAYTEGVRQTLILGTVSAGSVDNSASKASFSINANSTGIGGAFVCTVNSGTAGTLYGIGAFTGGNKTADSGDTLNVTVTLTAASA